MSDDHCYVLYGDVHGAYFIRLGFGVIWECGPRDMAHEFSTRASAAALLHRTGKHREGWRVLQCVPHTETREESTR